MRIDTGSYTGDGAGGGKIISLTNCVGALGMVASGLYVVPYGAIEAYFTSDQFSAGDALQIWSKTVVSGQITNLGTGQFTVDGELNTSGQVYLYLCFQYDGVTQDIETGSYTGDGNDNRNNAIIYGAWVPDLVAVAMDLVGGYGLVWRSNDLVGDNTVMWRHNGTYSNMIQAVNSGYAQIGTGYEINEVGETYHYMVLGEVTDYLTFVSWTGDGTDNRDLSLTSFMPDGILAKSYNAGDCVGYRERTSAVANTALMRDSASTDDGIQAFNVDGFQIGTLLNGNSETHYAWCTKNYEGATGGVTIPIFVHHYKQQRMM